jgi:hypothetical protein
MISDKLVHQNSVSFFVSSASYLHALNYDYIDLIAVKSLARYVNYTSLLSNRHTASGDFMSELPVLFPEVILSHKCHMNRDPIFSRYGAMS